jgi:RNA polymerase sigma factor (sigma-70 family)
VQVGLPEEELAFPGVTPLEEAAWRELRSRLGLAVGQLPAGQQHIFQDTVDGWKPAQIAAHLGISVKKVYSELHKARRTVKAALGLDPGGNGRP